MSLMKEFLLIALFHLRHCESMPTWHKVIFGNCSDMHEIPSKSVHLMVTYPPYFNAPFDSPDLFKDYDEFRGLLESVASELMRDTADGRICAFVTDDMLVKREKYPVVADVTRT